SEGLGRLPVMQHGSAVFWVKMERPYKSPVVLAADVVDRCDAQPVSTSGLQAAIRCLAPYFRS
ncbi:MAG: hypothetical protein ACYDBS_02660, partial [Acidimicrobiales bacterium]